MSSKFWFYDFKLYIDDLYNTIILHFQFCLIRIHQIITSQFFYEKDLTENDEKIKAKKIKEKLAAKNLNFAAQKSGPARMHGLQESTMAPFNEGHLLSGGGIGVSYPVFIG